MVVNYNESSDAQILNGMSMIMYLQPSLMQNTTYLSTRRTSFCGWEYKNFVASYTQNLYTQPAKNTSCVFFPSQLCCLLYTKFVHSLQATLRAFSKSQTKCIQRGIWFTLGRSYFSVNAHIPTSITCSKSTDLWLCVSLLHVLGAQITNDL